MSNVDINVDRRLTDGWTDGQKIGRLYRTLLQADAIKIHQKTEILSGSLLTLTFMYFEKILSWFKPCSFMYGLICRSRVGIINSRATTLSSILKAIVSLVSCKGQKEIVTKWLKFAKIGRTSVAFFVRTED